LNLIAHAFDCAAFTKSLEVEISSAAPPKSRFSNSLATTQSRDSYFFLFIRGFFGIRNNPGGNVFVRLAIESWSASLFLRGSFHQQSPIFFQRLDLLCLARPRVFVLAKQLRQRLRRSP